MLRLFVAAAVVLTRKALGKPQPLRNIAIGRSGFENDFARFAIADLDRIDDARALIGGDDKAIHQPKNRIRKVNVKQGFRSRELKHPSVLKEAVETPPSQIKKPRP